MIEVEIWSPLTIIPCIQNQFIVFIVFYITIITYCLTLFNFPISISNSISSISFFKYTKFAVLSFILFSKLCQVNYCSKCLILKKTQIKIQTVKKIKLIMRMLNKQINSKPRFCPFLSSLLYSECQIKRIFFFHFSKIRACNLYSPVL